MPLMRRALSALMDQPLAGFNDLRNANDAQGFGAGLLPSQRSVSLDAAQGSHGGRGARHNAP